MIILLVVIFAVSGFLLGFGDSGRGKYSRHISTIGGLVWLSGVIAAFWTSGIMFGLISIGGSFIIAGITMNIGKYFITKLRNKQ